MFQSPLSRNAWIFVIHCALLYKDIIRQARIASEICRFVFYSQSVCILLFSITHSYNNMLLNERYKGKKMQGCHFLFCFISYLYSISYVMIIRILYKNNRNIIYDLCISFSILFIQKICEAHTMFAQSK